MTFKRGDIVRVIGLDGPNMKLGKVHARLVEAFWFSEGVLMDSPFDLDAIELATAASPVPVQMPIPEPGNARTRRMIDNMLDINADWEPPDGWKGREPEPTTATVKGGPSAPLTEAITKARADADRLRAMMGDMSIALNDCLNAFRKRCGQGYMEELITRIEFLLSRGIPS